MFNLKKRLIACFCAVALLASTAAVPFTVEAKETQSSLNKKIENAQDKIDSNNKKKSNISKKVKKLQKEIAAAESELNKLSAQVEKAQKEVLEKKEKLNKGNKDLNSRLRNIYKGGSLGFVDVILSSENVSDLFSNFEMVKYIFKNDKEVVTKLKADYSEVKALEKSLKSKEKKLSAKQKELNSSKSDLTAQSKELAEANSSLEGQIDKWQEESEQLASEINNIVSSGGGYQGSVSSSSGGYTWPVPGHTRVTSTFGYRICPYHGAELHSGIDIPASTGNSVVAAKGGKVIIAGWYYSYGKAVVIDHGNGVTTLYGHNSALNVSVGQVVKKGQTIARIGSTGNSTGPHCHFEVRVNGTPRNPMSYL